MGVLDDLVKGMVILSFLVFIQNGCSVKKMAEKAAKAHKRGLTSYQVYSNKLTGYKPKRYLSRKNHLILGSRDNTTATKKAK